MMIRKNIYFVSLAILIVLLTACSSGEESAGNDSSETVEIDFSLFTSESDPFSILFNDWASEIEEKTEGRVKFNPYYSGQLVSLFDTLPSVKDNTIDGGLLSSGAISGEIGEVSILEATGTYKNQEQFENSYDPVNTVLEEVFDDNGMELMFWSVGATQFMHLSQDTFLKDPDQFKGLKYRTAGRWQSEQMTALGSSPVSMDPGELYLALQNKTVNATGQTPSLAKSFKLPEVAPIITNMTNAPTNVVMYVISPDVWDKISESDQDIMQSVSLDVGVDSFEFIHNQENELMESMIDDGAEIEDLNEEEESKLLDIMTNEELIDKALDESGEKGQEIYEIINENE